MTVGQVVNPTGATSKTRGPDGEEMLPAQCWCMRKVVLVPTVLLIRGRTLQCSESCE